MSLWRNIILVIISPKVGWEEIDRGGFPVQRVLVGGFFPQLALLLISSFMPLFYDPEMLLSRAVMNGIVWTSSYFVSYFVISYLLGGFYPELSRTKGSIARMNNYLLYCLMFLLLLKILLNMLFQFSPLYFLTLYLGVIAYHGTVFLRLEEHKVFKFTLIATLFMIGLPYAFYYLLSLIMLH